MNRYLPIKIGIYNYLIDLRGNTWSYNDNINEKRHLWRLV